MKLKKTIQLPTGTVIPAGTELHFGNEGLGYYEGEQVNIYGIPTHAIAIESKAKDGSDIYPNWLSKNNFGAVVTDVKKLVKGDAYIIKDYGDNAWHGDYAYVGQKGKSLQFQDTSNPGGKGDMLDVELSAVKSKDIYEQL